MFIVFPNLRLNIIPWNLQQLTIKKNAFYMAELDPNGNKLFFYQWIKWLSLVNLFPIS